MDLPPPAHAAVSRLAQQEVTFPDGVVLSPGAAHSNRVALAVRAGSGSGGQRGGTQTLYAACVG